MQPQDENGKGTRGKTEMSDHDILIKLQADVSLMLTDHQRTLYGNGQPGLKDRMMAVESAQTDCPARRNARRDNRMFWLTLISIVILFYTSIIKPANQERAAKNAPASKMAKQP